LGKIPLESGRNLSLFVGGDQPRTLFCIIVDPHRRSINTSGGNTTTACVLKIESGRGPSWGFNDEADDDDDDDDVMML